MSNDKNDDAGVHDEDSDDVESEPATSGHSDADSQTQRNKEDESPS